MEKTGRAYGFFRSNATHEVVVREIKDVVSVMAEYSDTKTVVISAPENSARDNGLEGHIADAKRRGLNYMIEGIGKDNTTNLQVANDLAMYLSQAAQLPEMMMPTEYGSGRIIYEEDGVYLDR